MTKFLSKEILHQLFEYKDGFLYWKIAPKFSPNLINKRVGSDDGKGYLRTKIDGKLYFCHRLIFMMFHGYLPAYVDHIDGNPANNQIENLREANMMTNGYNRKPNKNSASGCKNIYPSNNKWRVRITIDGKIKDFDSYFDLEVAKFVADTMRHKFHGKFARNH